MQFCERCLLTLNKPLEILPLGSEENSKDLVTMALGNLVESKNKSTFLYITRNKTLIKSRFSVFVNSHFKKSWGQLACHLYIVYLLKLSANFPFTFSC